MTGDTEMATQVVRDLPFGWKQLDIPTDESFPVGGLSADDAGDGALQGRTASEPPNRLLP